ncbi:CaiB/BaiF CoA transferase family protein [Orrella marina]|uniref:Formyl-CoA transferase n=1 Tax=Orrella marina TaxID=2163011 RepID=A0A2R4XIS8_9BURK|nr:CoA transferase [Orrella marina]AWB33711.1 formyl-CoA transferase [Orrella marina]
MSKIHASEALKPFRVLDLSRVRAGPNCVRVLSDFGADVIRIEPPKGVDPNEAMFAANRTGGDFQNLNRNKRSLTLNLKKPGALEIFMKLVETADVVVENWRPDVKRKLGLDYETLAKVNPRIILASISGYGQTGPYANRPGFDQIMQGMGGLMSVTGFPESGPVRAGLAVADMSAGLYSAIGILVALVERERSGKGQWVQTSLLHSQISMMDFQVARYLNEGDVPGQAGNDHPTSSPMGLFTANDGVFNIGASGRGNWIRLCNMLGHPEWIEHPDFDSEKKRVTNRKKISELLEVEFAKNTVDYWVTELNDAGVPAGPVYTVPQVVEDAQVKHLGVVADVPAPDQPTRRYITQPMTLSRTPAEVATQAPGWGEHTDEVLGELGLSDAEIAGLHERGVV